MKQLIQSINYIIWVVAVMFTVLIGYMIFNWIRIQILYLYTGWRIRRMAKRAKHPEAQKALNDVADTLSELRKETKF